MSLAIELCERGWLPDPLVRLGMRRLMANRLRNEGEGAGDQLFERYHRRLDELRQSRIALDTDKANEQHYEVPAEFFQLVLGRNLKYSCAWFAPATAGLDDAEEQMLAMTCERAELADGQEVLELGCGWGSLTLWMARRYPNSRITAVSNSASQREFILGRAKEMGLENVAVITADANDFTTDQRFDRVVSVEMFEHMRNYQELMARIAGWLNPGGKLFVHIFCHRQLMYPFSVEGSYDWMAEYFFTGGLMPSEHTLLYFQDDLRLERQWRVPGQHYEKTCNAWLEKLDAQRTAAREVFEPVYGEAEAERWINRWRMFFMACAELFGFDGGNEWFVAHYRFVKPADEAAAGDAA
jgi:cyclopropane-fatty-acyl-phospholipid synthase